MSFNGNNVIMVHWWRPITMCCHVRSYCHGLCFISFSFQTSLFHSLLCFISSYFSLYSSTSFSLPPLTSLPLKNLAHPKLLSTILSHTGRGVTVLNMIVRWAPPFCQKLELKSERHGWVLEPNTLFRDVWVIVGIEIWVGL